MVSKVEVAAQQGLAELTEAKEQDRIEKDAELRETDTLKQASMKKVQPDATQLKARGSAFFQELSLGLCKEFADKQAAKELKKEKVSKAAKDCKKALKVREKTALGDVMVAIKAGIEDLKDIQETGRVDIAAKSQGVSDRE